jgi:hypothetical protein
MITQILSDAEGNPTFALTSNGDLMEWQRSEMPFGGIQHKFEYLSDNAHIVCSPALGFMHKLIQAPQPAVASNSLVALAEARVKLAFGNCIVQRANPHIVMKVYEGEQSAKFCIENIELPSEETKHVGKFTAFVFALNTREDFRGWWNPDTKTIGFSK